MPNLDQGQTDALDYLPVRVPDTELKDELQDIKAESAKDLAPLKVPVDVLKDRDFELLMYRLFQDGQGSQAKDQCNLGIIHDDTALMQGTRDEGRDIALYRGGVAIGMVQCKHYEDDLSRPRTLKEICRFILAAKLHPELMPHPQDFTYVLAISRAANSKTVSLFHETATVLANNPELLPTAVNEARSGFKGLQVLTLEESLVSAREALSKIKLKLIQGVDLAIWLHDSEKVYSTFFQTRFVIEKEEVLRQLKEIKEALAGNFSIESLDHSQELSAVAIARAVKKDGDHRLVTLNEVYIQRTLETEIDRKIQEANHSAGEGVLIAVIAPAGFGKTSLLWGCHRRWSGRSNTVALALAATQIAALIFNSRFEKVRTSLLSHASTLRDGGVRFVVCLDTFDVLMHSEELSQPALKLIRELVDAGAALVFSTRPEEVAYIKLDQLVPHSVALCLSEYDTEEFNQALTSYCTAFYSGVNTDLQASQYADRLAELVASGRPAREVCLNPLTLRMLFELYAPADVPEDINAHDLYRRYLKDRVQSDRRAGAPHTTAKGKDLLPAAKRVATAMFSLKVPALTDDQYDQLGIELGVAHYELSELVSRHLVRRTAGRVEFFHQTFFEYITGLVLAEQNRYSLEACKTALINHANDRFEFPIREHQLWHCANSLLRDNTLLNSTVEELLSLVHPGPSGAALRLHMMDKLGYDSGRAYVLESAKAGNAFALKRYCQLIHHLPQERSYEVLAVIRVCSPHRSWGILHSMSQLITWLAPIDWPTCKQLITTHNLIEDLCRAEQQGGHGAKIVTDILRAGRLQDMEFVVKTAVRCLELFREKVTIIEFLNLCAETVTQDEGQFLTNAIAKWTSSKSVTELRATQGPVAQCLSTLWIRFPVLCALCGKSTQLVDSTELRLSLHALTLVNHSDLDDIYIGFLHRLDQNLEADALRLVLHHMAARLLRRPHKTALHIRDLTIQQCERLLAGLNITSSQVQQKEKAKAQVIFDFIRELKEHNVCPPSLQSFIATIPTQGWLERRFLQHLLPMAVTENLENALAAVAVISDTPQLYPHALEVLCAALPTLVQTPDHLDMALTLAINVQSSQLAIASIVNALDSQNREIMFTVARRHAPALQDFCMNEAKGTLIENHHSAYLLLNHLIRYGLIDMIKYPQSLLWAQRETLPRQTFAHTAAQILLVSCTTCENGEPTIHELLDAVPEPPAKVKDHVAPSLQHILCIPDVHLSEETLDKLVNFVLRPGTGHSLLGLIGWVMDIYHKKGDLLGANDAALKLLRSPFISDLSQMQYRRICHRLDKPFQRLYCQLSEAELTCHLQELYRINPLFGRVIVVALCKSDSPYRDALARQLTADKRIDSSLRTIVHDYRQYRWV
ncbi:hypothetical protein CUU62_21610 [Pseudomonas sp. WP001]|nr:hypothetical protein CUU62_21610 [Pseudomonas sp. WP001]